jgi:hypothetical protein
LRIASPAISRVGNGGRPLPSAYTAPNFSSRNPQSNHRGRGRRRRRGGPGYHRRRREQSS